MSYFKQTFMLNNEERKKISEMSGKILMWILEGRSIGYMSEMLHLSPKEIEHNIDEMMFLYNEAYKNRVFIADFDDKYMLYKMITCPVDIKDRELVSQWRRYCMSYTADISLIGLIKSVD